MQSYKNPLQPLWTEILVYALEAESQGGRYGSNIRLVSRQFNEEALRIWFVTRQVDPPRRIEVAQNSGPSHTYGCLLARRKLQVFLIRNEFVSAMCSELSTSLNEAIGRLRLLMPRNRIPLYLIDSILGDPWQSVLCTAFSSLYSFGSIRVALAPGENLHTTVADHGAEAWILVAACELGDLDLIRSSFADFNSRPGIAEVKHSFLTSCLCAAIRQSWQQAFEFFLDVELHLKEGGPICSTCPIRTAAEQGHLTSLKMLLNPENRVSLSQNSDLSDEFNFECAFGAAASYPNQSVRRELVQLLLKAGGGLPMGKKAIRGACQCNDQEVLSLALDCGDQDLFTPEESSTVLKYKQAATIIAAQHNSIDCLRLIFASSPPTHLWDSHGRHLINRAFQKAAIKGHLKIVRLILPQITQMSLSTRFLWVAKIDGGIAALELLTEPDFLERGRDVSAADTPWRTALTSNGDGALRSAVHYLSLNNVELLLDRGFKYEGETIGSAKFSNTETEVATKQAIKTLLERRGYR